MPISGCPQHPGRIRRHRSTGNEGMRGQVSALSAVRAFRIRLCWNYTIYALPGRSLVQVLEAWLARRWQHPRRGTLVKRIVLGSPGLREGATHTQRNTKTRILVLRSLVSFPVLVWAGVTSSSLLDNVAVLGQARRIVGLLRRIVDLIFLFIGVN
jgi:hypothetical protein